MNILTIRICGRISGAETYNLALLKELRSYDRINVIVITNLKHFATRLAPLVSKVICLPLFGIEVGTKKGLLKFIFLLPIYLTVYVYIIKNLNAKSKLDIICLQSNTEKIFLTPILKLFGYKTIWIEHGPFYQSQISPVIKWLHRESSGFVNKIIAVSENTKLDLIQGGVFKDQIEVIYIGVDTTKFGICEKDKTREVKKSLNIKASIKVIGFVGTVTKEKGLVDFIKISKRLIEKRSDLIFLVIGDGSDLQWMKQQVAINKIGKYYRFTGFIENINSYLGIVDLLLLPTLHNEGISMAILEGQSMGKVIFTRDIGGNSEIINSKENGFLYRDWNNEVISKDIVNFLGNPKMKSNLSQAARINSVSKFNIVKQTEIFNNFFSRYE